jgi:hypothetical protein
MSSTHGMAEIEPGVRLHYVLLHGFPETWWQWHRVTSRLVGAGFRVVASALCHAAPRQGPSATIGHRRIRRS